MKNQAQSTETSNVYFINKAAADYHTKASNVDRSSSNVAALTGQTSPKIYATQGGHVSPAFDPNRALYLVQSSHLGFDKEVLTEEALDLLLTADPTAWRKAIYTDEAIIWCRMPLTVEDVAALLAV